MLKFKKYLIVLMTITKLITLILITGWIYYGISHVVWEFLKLETWKLLFWLVTSKFFLIWILIVWIWWYLQHKGWIYNLFMFTKILIWYFIFQYKKTTQIFKTGWLTFKNFCFLIFPFSWKIYYELKEIDKKLLNESDARVINIIQNINSYFSLKAKLNGMRVVDYKVNNNTVEIELYRWTNVEASEIQKLENEDILNWIWLSIDKYLLEKEIKNNIKIRIIERQNNKIYDMAKYVQNFEKNTLHFWFDMLGNEVKHKLDFSQANHYWVYGKTGFWKTNFTSSLVYWLYLTNQNYNFIIIDPKWDFVHFDWLDRVEYAHEVEDIYKLLQRVKNNMKKVWDIFRENRVRNYKEYQENVLEKSDLIKPTFIFIEEFSKLLNSIQDTKKKEEIIAIVRELAIAGRSYCYNIVFSLQVPLKKIINDSEISRMLTPISFSIENSMNHHIFGTKINQNLEDLNIWEAILKNWYEIQKFKAYHIDKKILDDLSKNNRKIWISIEEKYLSHAKKINSFSKKEALDFGLQRWQFDELSRRLQADWIISKASNNSLYFTSKK